jgi:allantoin racemase
MISPASVVGRRSRRLLVINPNTNAEVTERVRRAALAAAPPGTEIDVINPARGPFAIETARSRAEAVPNIVSLIEARMDEGFDGYVLACFDDIGVAEARRLVPVPVVSMFGAGIAKAHQTGGPFAIVTTVASAVAGIERLAAAYGVGNLRSVRAAGIGVAEAAARTPRAEKRLLETIGRAIEQAGARAILLGSGALPGRAAALRERFGLPVIDGSPPRSQPRTRPDCRRSAGGAHMKWSHP